MRNAKLNEALEPDQLQFVVCKIDESLAHRDILRTDRDPLENKFQFVRDIERTEGRAIFRSRG